jgi:ABC-type Zn uptake system ZnuABC Zn-binding protein ZnuA
MRTMRRHVIAMAMVMALLGLGWCMTPSMAAPRLKVAATIFPLYDLVRSVAGSEVEVVLLVPPGASPHTFEAKPSTIRALTGSAVVFAIGHDLDDWAARLAQEAGVPRTIVVDAQISLQTAEHETSGHGSSAAHAHQHGAVDPHYWLAIPNAVRIVRTLAAVLGDLDPAVKQAYGQRAAAFGKQLQAVDDEIRQMLQTLPKRDIATFHPAFGYFAAAYNLHVVATFESSPGAEPGPRRVAEFLRQIETHKLRVLFVEPQLPRQPLEGLARDLGMTLQELDPLGGVQRRDSYIAMMRFNAAQIAAALRE